MDICKKKQEKSKRKNDEFPKRNETIVSTCVKRNSLFFVAFGVGKWDKSTLRLMFNKFEDYVSLPTYKDKLKIFSDGNDDYIPVLQEYFHKDRLCYGQKVKSKNGEKIYPAIRRKVFGNPCHDDIDTNTNECFNSILRERLSRLVRKSRDHSKKKLQLNNALFLFQFYWNFMHEIRKKLSPAMLEMQATKIWTWGNFLHAKLRYLS